MKTVLKTLVFSILLCIVLFANVSAIEGKSKFTKQTGTNTSKINSQKVVQKITRPWANSLYFLTGYGYPLGLKFELGYNFGNVFGMGLRFSVLDNWTGTPDDVKPSDEVVISIIGKFHFLKTEAFTPYWLFGYGGTIAILGEPDTYALIKIGSKIPIKKWLQVCPEAGVVFTSIQISGGSNIFGRSTPKIRDKKTRLGISISLEIDFRQIF